MRHPERVVSEAGLLQSEIDDLRRQLNAESDVQYALRQEIASLTALREADQATIASLLAEVERLRAREDELQEAGEALMVQAGETAQELDAVRMANRAFDSDQKALILQRDDLTALREADQATIASLELLNKELADALATVLKSAKPHPINHPAMYAAWAIGEAALRSTGRLQEPPQQEHLS